METVKMTGVSNLISEYHSIKRFMIKNNDKDVYQYIERLHNLLQNSRLMLAKQRNEIKVLNKQIEALNERLGSVCYYNERLSDSEKVLCRRIDGMKCWKGRILNIFGWELFQTPFKRSCKKI